MWPLALLALALWSLPAVSTEDLASLVPVQTNFTGYAGTPPLKVVPRKARLKFYPCSQCHQHMQPNSEVRTLQAPHPADLNHGKGRIWCLSCHHTTERDYLATHLDEAIDFDQTHLVCGGCHAAHHKDWYFGAHGKRRATWQGERVLYNCTHCHDPHDPTIKPRKAQPPPPVRFGLQRKDGDGHANHRIWERHHVLSE